MEITSVVCQDLFDLRPLWHGADRTLFGRDEIGRRVGKAQHFGKLLLVESSDPVLQRIVQDAGAEGISRAGGLDRSAETKAGTKTRVSP